MPTSSNYRPGRNESRGSKSREREEESEKEQYGAQALVLFVFLCGLALQDNHNYIIDIYTYPSFNCYLVYIIHVCTCLTYFSISLSLCLSVCLKFDKSTMSICLYNGWHEIGAKS